MRDLLMMVLGATLMALGVMFVLEYAMPTTMKVYDTEEVDTFNGRWMPLLPPQPQPEIRTDIRDAAGAPHCYWYACRVV